MQAVGYFGGQAYFNKEALSELDHYQSLTDYVNDRGSVIEIPMIDAQVDKVKDLKTAFELVYETEKNLLDFYVKFYEEAEDDMKDCVTAQFLLSFIEIQRKSVGEVKDILSMLEIAKDNSSSLLAIDSKLASL
jgi:ferritin